MSGDGFFFQAFVYLTAAVVSVPIAKRAGLGSVLGYLVAGALIGPHVLRLVGEEGQHVMHFAEFGVVMMLFLVGLELQPALLWRLRAPILGMGGLQVGLTAAAFALIGMALGAEWKIALAAESSLPSPRLRSCCRALQRKACSRPWEVRVRSRCCCSRTSR